VVERHGVKIMGYSNTPAHLPPMPRRCYSRNLYNFLSAFWDKEAGRPLRRGNRQCHR
jgi:H+-translocating NAD(P) transhydrogenase subunit alpha